MAVASLATPAANGAIRLALAFSIQLSRSAAAFVRIMTYKHSPIFYLQHAGFGGGGQGVSRCEMVVFHGHQPCTYAGRRRPVQGLFSHWVGARAPGCPLGDNAQEAPKALLVEPARKFEAVAAASIPLGMYRARELYRTSNTFSLATPDGLAHQFAAISGPEHNLLVRAPAASEHAARWCHTAGTRPCQPC